ncbi:MAG: hypothetical protein PHN49_04660 [Candidatus Omnitrophica bacterium]|nr:hypothetical protein [Candidatus Omnitrophota bacterium]MDD5670913.1 hypothetical protein [Candidatus Omnitrophota bacterium]
MKQAMLTVLGKDRPGIIAYVTGMLYRRHCNLEDISMTILEGEFAMMMVVSMPKTQFRAIHQDLERDMHQKGLSYFWHDFKSKLLRGDKHPSGSAPYLLTVVGRDRTGIVYQTSNLISLHGLNITDLNSKILGRGTNTIYTMLLEIDAPKRFNLAKLKRSLQNLGHQLKMEFNLKSVEHIDL